MTRAVSGMSVSGAGSRASRRARAMTAFRRSGVHDPGGHRDRGHPWQGADVGLHVALDLGAQRAAGHGEGDLDLHPASPGDADGRDHAQLDDVGAQLGIDHPPEGGAYPLLGRDRPADGVGLGGVGPGHIRNSTWRARPATRSDVSPGARRGYALAR